MTAGGAAPGSPAPPAPAPGLASRYVAFAQRHARALLLGALLLGLASLAPIARLALNPDLAELLPQAHPAIAALKKVAARQRSASNLIVLVHSPDAESNRRFAAALLPRLQALIPASFTDLVSRPSTDIADYARRWRWLYADLPELRRTEGLLDRELARHAPLWVELEDAPDAELRELEERWEERTPARPQAPWFEAQQGSTHDLGLILWRRREGLASSSDREALRAVQRAVEAARPQAFHPEMGVAYAGHIAQALDEQEGLRADLTAATALCCALVLAVLYLHFRRLALLLVLGAPVALGLLLALAVAALTLRSLNLNTAFLLAIIVGNGINAPIMLLGRYREERARGAPVSPALATALTASFRGTATAAAAASVAYGALLLTDFRGFSQFGWLGGAGMLLTWTLSFALVPPLALVGERLAPDRLQAGESLWERPFAALGRLVARHPRRVALAWTLLVAVGAVPLRAWLRDPLEWNFDKLRTAATPSALLWGRVAALGMTSPEAGYIGAHAVLLVDRPEQADPVAQALLAQDRARGDAHVLRRVRTLRSLLPGDQAEKLAVLARIRQRLDRLRRHLPQARWRALAALRPPDELRSVDVDDLPPSVLRSYTEVDGTRGRLLLIDVDSQTYSDWDGHALLRLARSLRVEALGRTWVAASNPTVFAGMIETLAADGPRLCGVAAGGVALLLLLGLGPRRGLAALGAVAVGIAALAGLAALCGLKINCMNFVALPITLGVGADYAANLGARLRGQDPADLAAALGPTGAAVALCSATTVIGYSSLLLSRNQALRSFGLLADLGELGCLAAALLVLPALLGRPGRAAAAQP